MQQKHMRKNIFFFPAISRRNLYLCTRLGDAAAILSVALKGNPVKSRSSARYCKAYLSPG